MFDDENAAASGASPIRESWKRLDDDWNEFGFGAARDASEATAIRDNWKEVDDDWKCGRVGISRDVAEATATCESWNGVGFMRQGPRSEAGGGCSPVVRGLGKRRELIFQRWPGSDGGRRIDFQLSLEF